MEDQRLVPVIENKVKLCASCLVGRLAGTILPAWYIPVSAGNRRVLKIIIEISTEMNA